MPHAQTPTNDADDQAVRGLTTAELFALATARLWVARCLNPDRSMPDWDGGFVAAGLERGSADAFDQLFRAIATGARRDMEFHCPSCPRLAEDEAMYLRMLALFQRGHTLAAAAILEDWLAPSALRLALAPACRFATALTWAKLSLPLRDDRAMALAHPGCSLETDPGMKLIH